MFRSKQFIAVGLCLLGLVGTSMAAATTTKGYLSPKPLASGTIVSLTPDTDVVAPSTLENARTILGVVSSDGEALISFSNDSSTTVQVSTSGEASALVSTVNGDIKIGDSITASPIAGIGAKATSTTRVVGIAQASFSSKSKEAKPQELKDTKGGKHKFYAGRIPVIVSTGVHSKAEKTSTPTSAVKKATSDLLGRNVNTAPLVIALLILALSVILACTVLYGAIRSSIVAVGRNPLARGQILRSLIQVAALVAVILLVGGAMTYFVLQF